MIAHLYTHETAKAKDGAKGFEVTGELTPSANQKAYIQLVWPRPSRLDAGHFKCEMRAHGEDEPSVSLEQTLTVGVEQVTVDDLVGSISRSIVSA